MVQGDQGMDLELANQNICKLCDWIEEMQALALIWPGYVNDAYDVDLEGCFVFKYYPFD